MPPNRAHGTNRIAVGAAVSFKWVAPRGGGMRGTVVGIRDETLFVRLDGERWRELPPVPAQAHELEPVDESSSP